MNKFYIIIGGIGLITLVSLGIVFAGDLTNSKTYDTSTKEVTITSYLGMGDVLLKAKLTTPQNLEVVRGKDRLIGSFVLEYFDDSYTLDKIITSVVVTNDTKEAPINKDYKLKYLVVTNVTNDFYNCLDYECEKYNIEKRTTYYDNWYEVTSEKDLYNGITLGIFTDVYANESGEWIPEFFSIKVPEWAVWNETFEKNLLDVYNFEESSGVLIDQYLGDKNGSANVTAADRQRDGAYNKAYYFNGTTANVQIFNEHQVINHPNNLTVAGWVFFNSSAGGQYVFQKGGYGVVNGHIDLSSYSTSYKILCQRAQKSVTVQYKYSNANAFNLTGWVHIACVYHPGMVLNLYVNGVLNEGGTYGSPYTFDSNTNPFTFGTEYDGAGAALNGRIDEFYIWSDNKSSTFISQLYSSGAGTFYEPLESSSTCEYSDGNWFMNCGEYCNITENVDLGGANLTINGTGVVNIMSNITSIDRIKLIGTDTSNICKVVVTKGGGFK